MIILPQAEETEIVSIHKRDFGFTGTAPFEKGSPFHMPQPQREKGQEEVGVRGRIKAYKIE